MKEITRTTSNNRLLRLAAFLEQLPRKRFDYGSLVGESWEGARDLSCGTTACALGWAAAMPEFRRLGLHIEPDEWNPEMGTVRLTGAPLLHEYDAAGKVFGLSYWEAWFLFEPSSQPDQTEFHPTWRAPGLKATPKQVAAHIRRFVKHRDSMPAETALKAGQA